jgi:superfamily II DNA or RNA helicase
MSLFEPQLLRSVSSQESFRRGKHYVDDGSVVQIELERLPSGSIRVTGTVYGSYAYHPTFTVSESGKEVLSHECDCRFREEGACKHVVALGLVAARRSVVSSKSSQKKKSSAESDLQKTLREHAVSRGVNADSESFGNAAMHLEKLQVGRGISGLKHVPRVRREEHILDRIELAFTYDHDLDLIRVEASAVYGPIIYPIEQGSVLRGAEDSLHTALRDWREEHQARVDLEANGFRQSGKGIFELSAEHAFAFLRLGLLDLSKSYQIRADDAFDQIAHIQEQEISSEWNFQEGSGEDWLSFSVNWACADRPLSSVEIERLANGYEQFVRAADGSFIEIKNRADLQGVIRLTEEGSLSKNGTHKLSRARAIELALRASENQLVRLSDTSESITSFLKDAKEGKLAELPNIPKKIADALRPYQKDGVAWAMFLRKYKFGGVLADDMGLGKTLQTLAVISTDRSANAGPSLVICPKTLISIWIAEAKRFTPDLSVVAVEGTAKEREQILKNAKSKDVLVTSYSLFQRDVKEYQSIPLYYAILDEAQYVKNSKTATALAVKLLQAKHRLALTGTPLENGVHELWSLFDFLMPGLLGNHTSFRFEFERPIRERADVDALQNLKRRVKPFLLRRTKESVAPELPPRVEQTDWCELTQTQAALYADVLASVRADVIEAVEKKGFARSRIEILAALTKLRQVCNHPALVDKRLSKGEDVSGKLAYALELVREAADGGHKILLFSQFTSMLDLIRPELDRMQIGHVTIEGKTRNRAEVIEKFKTDPNTSVFLMSLKAAGTGLTLTEADTVILYDPWWNPMVERQAMDRAHRIGQTKSVNVHKLVTKGTIEERVLSLQEKKKSIFDAVVSDTAEGFKDLTWEDVQGLFGEG